MISYLGSLVQFSPATGRAGHCRQISLCVDSTHHVLATLGLPCIGVSVLSPSTLLRLLAALYVAGPALSAVPVFGSSTKAWIWLSLPVLSSPPQRPRQPEARSHFPRAWRAFSLCGEWPRQLEACAHSPRVRRALSLRGPSARRWWGLRKSLDRNRGPVCGWERVASLGLSLPFSLPPASFLQWGWAGSSLEFLSPFVLRNAGSVFQPVNFSLLSHSLKKLPPTALRAFGPGPYPKQCRLLLSVSPPLAGGRCGRLGYFSAGSCF